MKTREVKPLLQSLGWTVRRDEVGDQVAVRELPDRVVSIIYALDRYPGEVKFGASLSVSTDDYSCAYSAIRGQKRDFKPLIVAREGIEVCVPEIMDNHIRRASAQATGWALSQDLDEGLRIAAALPTTAPGTGPLRHLAALVLLGETDRLRAYQASFAVGDRLGFVPYVTQDFIDRAMALAEGR